MKMNLNMSFEEGMKVVNALRECAINNCWDEDDLDECGIIEEYTSAVDAALTAMGISVSIASEPDSEVEDDEYCDAAADCYFCNSDDDDDDDDEQDEDEDEDDEEDEGEETFGGYRIRLLKDGRRALMETDAYSIMGIMREVVDENCPYYSDSTRRDMTCNMFKKFCDDLRIDLIITEKGE